jgi:tight adherence protein B
MDALLASAVFALVFVPLLVFLTSRRVEIDAASLRRRRMQPGGPEAEEDLLLRPRRQRPTGMSSWLVALDVSRTLEENMWQAGIYMRLGDMILIIMLLFIAGAGAGEFFWRDNLWALGAGLLLGALPLMYVRARRHRRLKAFTRQLPFALDLIKSSLEAGHSLQRALQVLVGEFGDPLGGEFRTVLEQTRIGLPLSRSLEEMLRRVPEKDLRMLVVAVKVQSEVGSSLAQIVGRLAELVRARQRLQLQIRALTAQARIGGMLVGLLPIFVLMAFSMMEPSYTATLFHDPTGIKLVKTAVVLDVLAILIIRRLMKVSY